MLDLGAESAICFACAAVAAPIVVQRCSSTAMAFVGLAAVVTAFLLFCSICNRSDALYNFYQAQAAASIFGLGMGCLTSSARAVARSGGQT